MKSQVLNYILKLRQIVVWNIVALNGLSRADLLI